jgi:hypothetical protein
MSSPQRENGFTAINHENFEELLKYSFPSACPLKISLYIIRQTWGFQKKQDFISLSRFQDALKISRPSVVRWLKYLVDNRLIIKGSPSVKKGFEYSFNKDWEQWTTSKGGLTSKTVFTSSSKGGFTKGSKGGFTHKRYNKEINKEYLPLSEKLKGNILSVSPEAKITDSQLYSWANDFRLMVKQDKRSIPEIETIIEQVFQNDFWKGNIRSAGKLRQQWNDGKLTKLISRNNPSDFLSEVINGK